ncbi:cell filamentation protein Fic, partial [Aliarcobacter cryaerophilus]
MKQDFKKLDELKLKLDSFRPLNPYIVKNLHEDLVLRWTYHSNAIEGNTL